MANPIIQKYLSDTSIPQETRANIANGLNSGQLPESMAVQGITAKYGDKYGLATPTLEEVMTSQGQQQAQPRQEDKAAKLEEAIKLTGGNFMDSLKSIGGKAVEVDKNIREGKYIGQALEGLGMPSNIVSAGEKVASSPFSALNVVQKGAEGVMNKLPEIGEAYQEDKRLVEEEGILSPLYRTGRVAKEALSGVGNIIAGGAKTIYGGAGLNILNPFDDRTMDEKSVDAIEGLNQSIQGAFGVAMSPLEISPTAKKLIAMPFEVAHDELAGAMGQLGVDTSTREGQVVVDSLMNAMLLALPMAKVFKNKGLSVKEGWDTYRNAPEMINKYGKEIKQELGIKAQEVKEGFKDIGLTEAEKVKKTTAEIENITGQIIREQTSKPEVYERNMKTYVKKLSEIPAEGIKTYNNLKNVLKSKEDGIRTELNKELNKYPDSIKLKDYKTTLEVEGKKGNINYLKTALDNLIEMGEKTHDLNTKLKYQALKKKANTDGLTIAEAYKVAQEYGTAFKEKSFTKTGEPLTSVNSQAFENIRKGVKEVVRDKMPNDVAKTLDKAWSETIKTENAVAKTELGVKKLEDRVFKRGVIEKIGNKLGDAVDIASFGGLKGFFNRFVPRNVNTKSINYLDAQQMLNKNLIKIQKLNKKLDALEKSKETPRMIQQQKADLVVDFIKEFGTDILPEALSEIRED